jgi:hypothetical protein
MSGEQARSALYGTSPRDGRNMLKEAEAFCKDRPHVTVFAVLDNTNNQCHVLVYDRPPSGPAYWFSKDYRIVTLLNGHWYFLTKETSDE